MSYPVSPQSLSSPLRDALKDPFAIAAIASLGAHGLAWVLLPIFPLWSAEPPEPEILRKVEVVELSPAEASRIPNFDGTIPGLPSQPEAPPPLPNDLFTLTPLPPQPPIPPGSFFTPPPADIFIPRNPGGRSGSSRSTQRRSDNSPSPSRSPAPSATPTPRPNRSLLPDRLNARTTELGELGRLQPQPAEPPGTEPSPTPTPSPAAGASPSPSATPTPSASPSPATAAAPSPSPTPASPDAARTERLLAERQRLIERYRELYTYNPQGTRAGDAQAAYRQWFADLGQAEPDSEDVKQVAIARPLPTEACRIGQEVAATYGVLVSPADEIVGEPRILQRSGFRGLDQQAAALVAAHEFDNPTDEEQVNYVTVTFTYSADRCPNARRPAADSD